MKTTITILLACALFGCKQVSKENWDADTSALDRRDININGMHYMIISQSDRGTFVVNLTKDSLEVEALKRQMK